MEQDIQKVLEAIKEGFAEPFEGGNLGQFLFGSSKRIRSQMVLLILKAMKSEISESIYVMLAAGELVHNSSLLHDDVLDDAEERRGCPTIGNKFGAKSAILAGDYLLTLVLDKVESLNSREVSVLFKNCMSEMILGEMSQFLFRGKIPKFENYLNICKQKTAILFKTMLESAFVLADVKSDEMIRFADLFGTFFQIKNDMDNVSAEADKRNQIYTAVDILGIEKTEALLDNYKEEMMVCLETLPDSVYKERLGDLFREL